MTKIFSFTNQGEIPVKEEKECNSNINNLIAYLQDLLYKHALKGNGMFEKIKSSAKSFAQNMNLSDKRKLCYIIAVLGLKSGLFFVLGKLYEEGFDDPSDI